MKMRPVRVEMLHCDAGEGGGRGGGRAGGYGEANCRFLRLFKHT